MPRQTTPNFLDLRHLETANADFDFITVIDSLSVRRMAIDEIGLDKIVLLTRVASRVVTGLYGVSFMRNTYITRANGLRRTQ